MMKTDRTDTVYDRLTIENNETPALCAACGGECCRNYAGAWWPEQFGDPEGPEFSERIIKALSSGQNVVDWWEGDIDGGELSCIYFLRPRHTNDPVDSLRCPSWGGACIHLAGSGCALTFAARPQACRLLTQHNGGDCTGAMKDDWARAWRPYQIQVQAALHRRRHRCISPTRQSLRSR